MIKMFVLAAMLFVGGQLLAQKNHEYVDLGLPSGTLWATCNVGATTPEGYGDYFAWGDVEAKSSTDWGNYKYGKGKNNQLTKYCLNSSYGYNGFSDKLMVLQADDDAAKTEAKADEKKADDEKADDAKADEEKKADDEKAEEKPADDKPAEEAKADEEKPAEEKAE